MMLNTLYKFMLIFLMLQLPDLAGGCTWWSMHTGSTNEAYPSAELQDQLQKFRQTGSQPAGWAYMAHLAPQNKKILEYRSKLASDRDPDYLSKISQVIGQKPRILMVHNWLRVTGPVNIPNPYPHKRFIKGKWYFLGDNGVSDMRVLYNTLDKAFLARNPVIHGDNQDNYQMGELWLLLVLQEIERHNGDSEAGFIGAVRKMNHYTQAAIIFSDGTKIWCFSDVITLYYYFDHRTRTTIISSGAKADKNIKWETIPGGSYVLTTSSENPPQITHIDDYN